MARNLSDKIHRINYLNAEMEGLYHQASLKLEISDSVSRVLYTIYDAGESCLLSDIYKQSGSSKQTVHSAVRQLERDGILYLEPYKGRAKKIFLTPKGQDYVARTAARLYEAEKRAFASWSEEEIDAYIRQIEKYIYFFRQEVEAL